MSRPLIGVTGRRRLAGTVRGLRPSVARSWLDLHFADYGEHLVATGAAPVQLPQATDPRTVVARLDGLVLSGGADVDPRRYGRTPGPGLSAVEPERDAFEIELLACAWEARLPVFAICRGTQLLAVARGGTLVDDLPADSGEGHPGEQYPTSHPVHDVRCTPGSLAERVFGAVLRVNSLHHQAVEEPGAGLTVTGRAADGVAEVVEAADRPILGVQWHPERLTSPDPGFAWLVATARQAQEQPASA